MRSALPVLLALAISFPMLACAGKICPPAPVISAAERATLHPIRGGDNERLRRVEYDRTCEAYPDLASLKQRPYYLRGTFEVCVHPAGFVYQVTTLKWSGDERARDLLLSMVRRWRYRPFLVDGRPVAFCHPMDIDYIFP